MRRKTITIGIAAAGKAASGDVCKVEIPSPESLETGQKTLENAEQEGPPQGGESPSVA